MAKSSLWMMALTAAILGVTAVGCDDGEGGSGTLSVEIWGEDFIEQQIPADVFVDGWTLTYDRFLVSLSDVTSARGDASPDLVDETQRIFDLTRPGPYPFLTEEVPAGRYDQTTYVISPAGADAVIGNASADDLELMQSNGYSVYVEGHADKGDVTKTFAWGFSRETHYNRCESQADIANGEADTIQITIHGDHLFYDDLFSHDPDVTFDTVADADADDDGEITREELEAFNILTLPNYGTGSVDAENLWEFIDYLTSTIGHIDGEGHCHNE